MTEYKVMVAPEAKEQIKNIFAYLLFVLRSEQAYKAVRADYRQTLKRLQIMAGMIKQSDDPELIERGLKKIHFEAHDYILLFRISEGDEPVAEVVKVFHTLEDYQHKLG